RRAGRGRTGRPRSTAIPGSPGRPSGRPRLRPPPPPPDPAPDDPSIATPPRTIRRTPPLAAAAPPSATCKLPAPIPFRSCLDGKPVLGSGLQVRIDLGNALALPASLATWPN